MSSEVPLTYGIVQYFFSDSAPVNGWFNGGNWRQRKILEAWEINCAKDPLNRDDGALLPKEYLHLTIAEKKK